MTLLVPTSMSAGQLQSLVRMSDTMRNLFYLHQFAGFWCYIGPQLQEIYVLLVFNILSDACQIAM